MVIRPWLNLPTGGHGHVICMGNLWGVSSRENTPEETHKSSFIPYKQISGRNEWSMLSYYVINYEKFRKVMQRTEKEALIIKLPSLYS